MAKLRRSDRDLGQMIDTMATQAVSAAASSQVSVRTSETETGQCTEWIRIASGSALSPARCEILTQLSFSAQSELWRPWESRSGRPLEKASRADFASSAALGERQVTENAEISG